MKTFNYNLDGRALSIRVDDAKGTIADITVDGRHPVPTAAEMPAYAAAISLALIHYEVEVVHDEEPGVITLAPASTGWARPFEMINQLESSGRL